MNKNPRQKSIDAYEVAKTLFPGGVNSPVRAFGSVGGTPAFIKEAHGSKIIDIDANEYIDYVGSWGPMILGNADEHVVNAIRKTAINGTSFGAPTEAETTLGLLIKEAMPSIEMMRFVSSGTEATMAAIRLARAYTSRTHILKFDGGYHGAHDAMLVSAGSGVATFALPNSPGVLPETAEHTLVIPMNDIDALSSCLDEHGKTIAAVIIEPVAGNAGCIPPRKKYLQALRDLTQRYGVLLIFDEVMTGFRVGPSSAQGLYNVKPDITTLGKIVGGGLPLGVYGGKTEIMKCVAPDGDMYQGGTLSGNPLATVAGAETLKRLRKPSTYIKLSETTRTLLEGIKDAAISANQTIRINRVGSMFTIFFTDREVWSMADAKACDAKAYGRFFHKMLRSGVYLPPSSFECCFVSTAHSTSDIEKTISASYDAFKNL